jgi:hypothetical protein
MPLAGFELPIPAFERAKTVHALDRAATVIGFSTVCTLKINHTGQSEHYRIFYGSN